MSGKDDQKSFPLPKSGCWAIHKSKTQNRYYYYNIITGKSYWERPKHLTDNELRELNFPEGNFIPEEVNGESGSATECQPDKSKKDNKSLEKVAQKKKCPKITSKVSKDSGEETVLKQCKTSKAARRRRNKARKKIEERLMKDTSKAVPRRQVAANGFKLPSNLAPIEKPPLPCSVTRNMLSRKNLNSSSQKDEESRKRSFTSSSSAPVEKPPLPCSVTKNMLPRKNLNSSLQKDEESRKNSFISSSSDKLGPELPDYSDSDEDQPKAKKVKATDDAAANKCQSENSEEKVVDSEQNVLETSRIDNWEFINNNYCREVVTEQPVVNYELEEMDWSPDTINNNVDEIESESGCTEWSNLENESIPMEIDIANPKDTFIVIDTNIIIHNMELVESLLKSELADGSKRILIIPWQVLKELDDLKTRASVGLECRGAIKFLHRCFSNKSSNVIAQNAISAKLCAALIEIEVPDDNILACCLEMMGHDRRTVLLTNDLNLCNKAIVHNIEAYTRDEFVEESKSLVVSIKNDTKKTGSRSLFSRDPPSPAVDNIPFSVVKNLLDRNYLRDPSEVKKERQAFFKRPLGTREKAINLSEPPRQITRIISNPSSASPKSPTNKAACSENKSFQAPVEEPPLPYSVTRNMLPRKNLNSSSQKDEESRKRSFTSSSSGIPEKASGTLPQKRPAISNTTSSSALKSPSGNVSTRDQSQVRPSFQEQETPFEMRNEQPELLKYVKLSPTDYNSTSTNKFKKFEIAVAEFIFSILRKGMSVKGDWTKRIILSPPWTVEQLCICLQEHWLSLADHFPSQQIQERLQFLQKFIGDIDNKNLTLQDLNMAINICYAITPPLKNNLKYLVENFETKLKSLLSKLGGSEEVSHQYWSCFTEDVDSSRCLDLLSKILNKTVEFLASLHETIDNCCTRNGEIDFESTSIFQLSQFSTVLPNKLKLTTFIISGLKAILDHGSNVPQAPIDQLTLCLMEETEYPDPFFSKDDVIGLSFEVGKRVSVQEYWTKYEDVRNKLLIASKKISSFKI